MIRLTNATTDLLRVTPSGADAVKAVVSYSDKTVTAYTGGTQVTAIAAASITTICGTPGASTIRDIDHVTLYCAIANTLSVGVTVSATEYMLIVAALSAGDTLEYTHAHGWRVIDSNGAMRVVFGNVTGNLAVGGTLAVTGNTTLTGDLAVNGGDLTSTASTFNLLAANATTVNAFGAASVALNIGNASAAAAFPGGVSIPTGKNVTGAGTAAITGFKSGSFGTVGNLGAIYLLGSTSGTATFTTDATTTEVTLDKPLDLGANALTAGAISGTTLTTSQGVLLGGATALNYMRHQISNTFTSGGASTLAVGTYFSGTITGAAGDTTLLAAWDLGSAITTQTATESVGVVTQLYLNEPSITNNLTGGGVITNASTLYIAAAPTEGAANYALYAASGATYFGGNLTATGTTINMTTSGTTLTVGVGADNGTVSAGVFTDRTKAFEGDAVGELRAVKAVGGHIDHATLPAFARENVRKQVTDAEGKVTETVEVERNIGAMVSILTVAAQELDARVRALEAK